MDFTCRLSFLSFLLPLSALSCSVCLDVVSDQVLGYSWERVWWIKFIAYGNGNFITALWVSGVRWVQTLQEFTGPGKNPGRSKSREMYLYFQTSRPFFESDHCSPSSGARQHQTAVVHVGLQRNEASRPFCKLQQDRHWHMRVCSSFPYCMLL